MPGNTPTGLLPTGRGAPGVPGTEVSIATGPAGQGGRATAPHARILVNGTGYGAPYSFAVASRAALADPAKAAAIRDYLKILNQAYGWGGSHVSTWASVWVKATGLPDSIMLKAAQDDVRTPVQITPAVVGAEQSVSNAFRAAGLIPGHVDFRNFSDSGFNDTVGGAS